MKRMAVVFVAVGFLIPFAAIELNAQEPTRNALDSLRARVEEVSRQQQEEIRRIQESRQEEMENLRVAIEMERSRIVEAERSLAAAERALSVAQGRGEVATGTALAESLRQLEYGVQLRQQVSGPVTPRPTGPMTTTFEPFPSTASPYSSNLNSNATSTTAVNQTMRLFSAFTNVNAVVGAELVTLNAGLAAYFDVDRGVLVAEVAASSPAGESGLLPGDVITEIGGTEVSSVEEVGSAMVAYQNSARTSEEASGLSSTLQRPQRIFSSNQDGTLATILWSGTPVPLRIIREGRAMEITLDP